MEELRPSEADAFIERFGAFGDAVVRAVDFDLRRSTVTIDLEAQDGQDNQWAWRGVCIVVEGLIEWAFTKPERLDGQVVFEAGIAWDSERALLSLDTSSAMSPDRFRNSALYFGGATIRYEVSPLSV